MCALFCVLTAMTHTTPLFAPATKPAATPTPLPPNTAVTKAKDQTEATKSTKTKPTPSKETDIPCLGLQDRKNLRELLDDSLVKDELSQTIQDKVRAIINPQSGTKPTEKPKLTKEESEELKDFMIKYGAQGHFTDAVQKSTQNLLKENAKKLGGQWAFMFTVSLAAMTASGAIAAAAAG